MKNMIFIWVAAFLLMGCDKEEILISSQIPDEIAAYASNHFPDNPIITVVKDIDGLDLTYDLTLVGGFRLEFGRNREVIDIEGITKLPDSVIPVKILDHVLKFYAESFIVGWEIDHRHQQIQLNNGFELEFTMEGEFLRTDN